MHVLLKYAEWFMKYFGNIHAHTNTGKNIILCLLAVGDKVPHCFTASGIIIKQQALG